MGNFNSRWIESLASAGTVISTEDGYTTGVTYRERYKLADGRYMDVTRDRGWGDREIIAYAIRKTKRRKWQVSL